MAASASDAHPFVLYNARYRFLFPILDADGDLTTGAASLDSELSQDCGTFADATNEATEIATSSGMYYLDLIATELDTKSTSVIVKTATAGAKTTPVVLYPKRLPVIRTGTAQAGGASSITLDSGASAIDDYYTGCYVNITNNSPSNALGQARKITAYVGSTKVATVEGTYGTNPSSASTFEVLATDDWINRFADVRAVGGTAQTAGDLMADTNDIQARLPAALVGGRMDASVGAMASGVLTAAAIAADAITAAKVADGTIDAATFAAGAINAAAIAADAITAAKIADGAIDAATFAAGAITAAAIASDAITDAKVASDVTIASVTGAVGSVTGAVGSVTGAVGSVASGGITAASFGAGAIDAAAIAANAIGASELAADAVAEIQSGLATAANLATVAGFLDTEIAAILADTNELQTDWVDGGRLDLILDAASAPSASVVADAVWDEALAGHLGAGTTGTALNAAGSAGDPWSTSIPGAYGAGSAGKIVGDNLNATVSSRAPESGGNVAAIKAKTDQLVFTIANKLDASLQAAGDFAQAAADKVWATAARILTAGTNIALAKGTGVTGFNDLSAAQVNAEADTALADVGVTSTVTGRIDAAITTRATPAQVATELATYDAPTHTELTAELATADDAVLSAIAALNNLSSAGVLTQVNAALDTTLSATIPADGTRPTLRQGVYMNTQFLYERTVSGTTLTVKNPDGTTLAVLTLGDATSPQSVTRTT